MASQPVRVRVTSPIHAAIERTQDVLFRPFDLGKWFVIGFGAWLARLGQPGFSGLSGRLPTSGRTPTTPWSGGDTRDLAPGAAQLWDQARSWLIPNLYWIVPLAIGLFVFLLAFGLLLAWLASRGEFMFLHCVALDRAEVGVPWRRYAREARSLFVFRLALGLIVVVPALLLVAMAVVVLVRMTAREGFQAGSLLLLGGVALAFVVLALAVGAVHKLTTDLVVPIMFLRGCSCREGWRELLGLYAGNFWLPIVYLLFQILLGIGALVLVVVAVVATCCLAGCLMVIPYLGTVALLPVLVFYRSYSLCYLAQFGPQYDLFRLAVPPPVGAPAPLA